MEIADKINNLLPQLQCEKCGYPGCAPYAKKIANGQADINLCIPGDDITVKAIAKLLDVPAKPVLKKEPPYQKVAHIDEDNCIGCTKCLKACPVDAIIGAAKQMHVILSEYCTGCELCLSPCPTDCITLLPNTLPTPVINASSFRLNQAQVAKKRYQARLVRLNQACNQKQKVDQKIIDTDLKTAIAACIKRAAQKPKQSWQQKDE